MSGILLAVVGNSYSGKPVNTVAPVVSGTALVGSTLSCTTGTWTGTTPISYTYQWQRSTTNISGATSSSYTIQVADEGSTLRCVVTATNVAGSTSANSANTAVVTNPGKYIAVGSENTPYFTLLDHTTPGTLSLATTYTIATAVRGVDFNPTGNYIALGAGSGFTLLNHSAGSVSLAATYAIAGTIGNYNSVKFSPSGAQIAIASQTTPYFTLLNHSSGSVSLATTYTLPGIASGVAFSPLGNYIGVVHNSSTFTLLNHSSGSVSFSANASVSGLFPNGVSFSPAGTYVAASGTAISLFDYSTPGTLSLSATYPIDGRSLAFSPSGDYLAVGGDDAPYFVLLDHTTPGTLSLATTYSLGNQGNCVAFNAVGNYIAVARFSSPAFVLLNHSAGSVSLAATYAVTNVFGQTIDARAAAFSPN